MNRLLIRYLLFSGVFLTACISDYKGLRQITPDEACIERLKPESIAPSWYTASIDVVGRHISGLLLVKAMPDSSWRIVFTNETGVKFLDFEFADNNAFKVHYIIDQLDKKPVIRLLKSDFELMLALPFKKNQWMAWQNGDAYLYGMTEKGEKHYFITGQDCASLHRVETGSKRKRMVSLQYFGDKEQPDSIQLQHHTFAMQIKLKKLATD